MIKLSDGIKYKQKFNFSIIYNIFDYLLILLSYILFFF